MCYRWTPIKEKLRFFMRKQQRKKKNRFLCEKNEIDKIIMENNEVTIEKVANFFHRKNLKSCYFHVKYHFV